jgi:hypothetical protein
MTNTKQAPESATTKPAAKPKAGVAAAKPEVPAVAVVDDAVPAAPVTIAVTARARGARKAPAVAETVAKHQKALAEALEQAEAICYDPPQPPKAKPVKAAKAAKPAKVEKPVKAKKPKLVRDSYAMPETEYAQIAVLKKRVSGLGSEVKKSELLRAGVAVLAALNDEELKAVTDRVERIKTGRPSKK